MWTDLSKHKPTCNHRKQALKENVHFMYSVVPRARSCSATQLIWGEGGGRNHLSAHAKVARFGSCFSLRSSKMDLTRLLKNREIETKGSTSTEKGVADEKVVHTLDRENEKSDSDKREVIEILDGKETRPAT